MNEKDGRFQNSGQQHRPDVLRAKDIIPGSRRSEIENEGGSDIPKFDLAQNIMTEHRQLIAARRKGPSSIVEQVSRIENQESSPPRPTSERVEAGIEHRAPSIEFTSQWDPLIADIVSRDIEQFCGSGWS